MHRGRYLAMYGKTESNKHFLQYVDKIEIDEEKIEAKVRRPPFNSLAVFRRLTGGTCLHRWPRRRKRSGRGPMPANISSDRGLCEERHFRFSPSHGGHGAPR